MGKDGDPEVVRRLVREQGLDVNYQVMPKAHYRGKKDKAMNMFATMMEGTPLHFAVFNGQVGTVKVLLELGADPTLRNTAGMTPWDMARVAFGEVPGPIADLLGEELPRAGGCFSFAPKRAAKKPAKTIKEPTGPVPEPAGELWV